MSREERGIAGQNRTGTGRGCWREEERKRLERELSGGVDRRVRRDWEEERRAIIDREILAAIEVGMGRVGFWKSSGFLDDF